MWAAVIARAILVFEKLSAFDEDSALTTEELKKHGIKENWLTGVQFVKTTDNRYYLKPEYAQNKRRIR